MSQTPVARLALLLLAGTACDALRVLTLSSHRAAAAARASPLLMQEETAPVDPVAAEVAAAASMVAPPPGWEAVKEFWSPEKSPDIRIEGGQTLKTFKMPEHAERVQYIITSPNGRPIKAKVELWIGPLRCVHEMKYDCMAGGIYPLAATLQFKKLSPVLKVSTDSTYEFPLVCGVFVPSPDESKALGKATSDMFYSAPMKDRVQGGSTIDNKGGAIRSFAIDDAWEKTQIMVWSKDVGKKSFKTNIEVLQGPNNQKQHINLRCGGSTQPYHCVIDTPGNGWMLRCNSKKYLEDGLFEIAVAPYEEVPVADQEMVMVGGAF